MNITVVGIGYVGLSIAVLLSQNNCVTALDIDEERVHKINNRISPIEDKEIELFFKEKKLNLIATCNREEAFKNPDIIVIATPTNYDVDENYFDTSSIETTLDKIASCKTNAAIVIKSTIPIGYIDNIRNKYTFGERIFFAPEFLREGKALYDNLYPSRIVIGSKSEHARQFAELLTESAIKEDIPVLFTNTKEAEAIKLFANSYLALRVSYFNELDTFAEMNNMNAKDIIDGMCYDFRIGDEYNNPSFGYGGYCLPKDTKQLLANYKNIPQELISAVVKSNATRKRHIADAIYDKVIKNDYKTVGLYRLIMKADSDNFRESAIQDILSLLKAKNVNIIIFEPKSSEEEFMGCKIINDLSEFKNSSDIIVANRIDEHLLECRNKVYTRDLYGLN